MSVTAAAGFGLVRREQKQQKLEAFIADYLDHPARRRSSAPRCFLVLARSAESPAAKAVLATGLRGAGHGLSVRAIFATLGEDDAARLAELCRSSERGLQVRWARDVRLMDAHEQLVLGETTSWTGDCMRREPSKHDAFEAFMPDSAEAARRAILFFERLWHVSVPIIDRPAAA